MARARDAAREAAQSLAIPAAFFATMVAFVPFGDAFEYSYDEGVNLVKAMLYARGEALYVDIWSDQPPLFTLVLSRWIAWFGPSVYGARLLVLASACALLWAFYATIRRNTGTAPAALATLGLLFSRHFLRLSVTVMIGMPALAVAMGSLYALDRYVASRRPAWLAASGILLGLALQVKLFCALLVPIGVLALLLLAPRDGRRGALARSGPPCVWLGAAAAAGLPFVLGVYSNGWSLLVESHTGQAVRDAFDGSDHTHAFLQVFAHHQPVMVLALLGAWSIVRRRRIDGVVPLAWLVCGPLLLWLHTPIWYHHKLLVSIPLFWLAAYGIEYALTSLGGFPMRAGWRSLDRRGRAHAVFLGGCLVASVATLALAFPAALWRMTRPDEPCIADLQDRVTSRRGRTNWIWTDQPMFAFRAGLPVPPEIAVVTRKRVLSGNLTEEEVIRTLDGYRPEQLLIGRFDYSADFDAYLARRYSPAFRCGERTHFVLDPLRTSADRVGHEVLRADPIATLASPAAR